MMQIAFYKGPAVGFEKKMGHWLTCAVMTARDFQWCPYSHIELVIDGLCHSSSAIDVMTEGPRKGRRGGMRVKAIDLTNGKWDVFNVRVGILEQAVKERFMARMAESQGYDWPAGIHWALPFVQPRKRADNCLEAVAYALGADDPSEMTFRDILEGYCAL